MFLITAFYLHFIPGRTLKTLLIYLLIDCLRGLNNMNWCTAAPCEYL